MLRLLIDENFNHRILRGLKRRLPSIDFLLVEQVGLKQAEDLDVLAWAANEKRTVLTHDRRTMIADAERLVVRGQSMAGVILVPEQMAIGQAVNDLEIVIGCSDYSDLRDRIEYLPL